MGQNGAKQTNAHLHNPTQQCNVLIIIIMAQLYHFFYFWRRVTVKRRELCFWPISFPPCVWSGEKGGGLIVIPSLYRITRLIRNSYCEGLPPNATSYPEQMSCVFITLTSTDYSRSWGGSICELWQGSWHGVYHYIIIQHCLFSVKLLSTESTRRTQMCEIYVCNVQVLCPDY